MQILLINTNPVVSRLITLCLKEKEATLHEVSSLDEVENRHYDLALIDDAVYQQFEHTDLQALSISKTVLLSRQAMLWVMERPNSPSRMAKRAFSKS